MAADETARKRKLKVYIAEWDFGIPKSRFYLFTDPKVFFDLCRNLFRFKICVIDL